MLRPILPRFASLSEGHVAADMGSCGCVAQALGATLLLVALAALGFLLALDNPERWQGIADPEEHPLALVTDVRDARTIYVGTEQGHILVSHDGGQSWIERHDGLPQTTPVSALAITPDIALLAGVGAQVYRSADGGQTWRRAGAGLPAHTIVDTLLVLPTGIVLAGTTNAGVYEAHIDDFTWAPASTGLPPRSAVYSLYDPQEQSLLLAGLIGGGVYASRDGGATWTARNQGLEPPEGAHDINVFTFIAVPRQGTPTSHAISESLLAGTSGGLYRSDDGVSWQPADLSLGDSGTTRVLSLARDPLTASNIVAGTDRGVLRSQDGGRSWRPLGFGLPPDLHVGVVRVVHPSRGEPLVLAAVDQLYQYPGQGLLATSPWRGLAFAILVVLVGALLALLGFATWQLRR
jgi:photosystem II stability/assembly factor-like uncharacterized protein